MERLTVPAVLDSLGAIGKYVLAAARAAGLEKVAAYRLRGAVDEIATNIITHGYCQSGSRDAVEVHAETDGDNLKVILEDTRPAFDPRQVPLPVDIHLPAGKRKLGGLGIYLALQGVEGFHYERGEDRNRNVFTMKLPGTPPGHEWRAK